MIKGCFEKEEYIHHKNSAQLGKLTNSSLNKIFWKCTIWQSSSATILAQYDKHEFWIEFAGAKMCHVFQSSIGPMTLYPELNIYTEWGFRN